MIAARDARSAPSGEDALRVALDRARQAITAIVPVLTHLVGSEPQALFSDEVIARTRGVIESLALQLARMAGANATSDHDRLVAALIAQPALLRHCHALAIEAQTTERVAQRSGLDPVLSPLLQDRIAAHEGEAAAAAMSLMAAQARFVLAQRRMEIAPAELPADLLHDVLAAYVAVCGAAAEAAAARLRDAYSEARSRTALLAEVALGLNGGFLPTLRPDRAGTALFLTALSLATGEDRGAVAPTLVEGQQVRLALLLAAAGLGREEIEQALLHFHPDSALPEGALELDRAAAQTLLAQEAPGGAGQ